MTEQEIWALRVAHDHFNASLNFSGGNYFSRKDWERANQIIYDMLAIQELTAEDFMDDEPSGGPIGGGW